MDSLKQLIARHTECSSKRVAAMDELSGDIMIPNEIHRNNTKKNLRDLHVPHTLNESSLICNYFIILFPYNQPHAAFDGLLVAQASSGSYNTMA